MKVVVIGSTGTIGRAIVERLSEGGHDVVRVGHSSGDLRVDITDTASIARLFASVGRVDAVVSAAGTAHTGPLVEMTDGQAQLGVMNKLLGQINVARLAVPALNDRGSITISSGLASRVHHPGWAVLAAVNAGLEAFGTAAALELPRNIRINVVSPGMVLETAQKYGMKAVDIGTPAAEVARAYVQFVEGRASGTVADVGRV